MPYLAVILLAPWLAILGMLFWMFPRTPRTSARRVFDILTLLLASAGSIAGMLWAYAHANTQVGAMWKQILAVLVAYGVFSAVMAVALVVRRCTIRP